MDINPPHRGMLVLVLSRQRDLLTVTHSITKQEMEEGSNSSELSPLNTFIEIYRNEEQPIFDAHCHLQLPPFPQEEPTIADHLALHNISNCSVCSTSPADWEDVERIHRLFPSVVIPSFGIHPWYIRRHLQQVSPITELVDSPLELDHYNQIMNNDKNWLKLMEDYLRKFPSAGVGECGVDKNVNHQVSMLLQQRVLHDHLKVAAMFGRFVSIHCVSGCWGHLLTTLNEALSESPPALASIILHACNSLPTEMLPQFSRIENIYFSFSATIVDNAKHQRLLKMVPRDRLLLESDSPDQSPRLARNAGIKVNSPAIIKYSSIHVAEILGLSAGELLGIVFRNALRATQCRRAPL